jgi:hypothetical protein
MAACGGPTNDPAPNRTVRQALFDELRPVPLANCRLERFGSPNDGGYLLCGNLNDGVESAYSYGIGPRDDWGCDVAKRFGIMIHQYDCFDPGRPACDGGRFDFHDECIAGSARVEKGERFDTLENHIASNGDRGKRLLVKIDVEGAEWESLLATPDAVLERIDQLPMELHGVTEERFLEVVRKLKRTFHVVNFHSNNWACSDGFEPFPGPVFQVLLVNKRIGVLDGSAQPLSPNSLPNAPDNPNGPDCQPPR